MSFQTNTCHVGRQDAGRETISPTCRGTALRIGDCPHSPGTGFPTVVTEGNTMLGKRWVAHSVLSQSRVYGSELGGAAQDFPHFHIGATRRRRKGGMPTGLFHSMEEMALSPSVPLQSPHRCHVGTQAFPSKMGSPKSPLTISSNGHLPHGSPHRLLNPCNVGRKDPSLSEVSPKCPWTEWRVGDCPPSPGTGFPAVVTGRNTTLGKGWFAHSVLAQG